MPELFDKHGGFRKLHSFTRSCPYRSPGTDPFTRPGQAIIMSPFGLH